MPDLGSSIDGEILRLAGTAGVGLVTSVLTYFLGRSAKSREFLTSDLSERAKEFRDLLGTIEKNAVEYWVQDRSDATAILGEGLRVDLHRLQSLRVYCADMCGGFKSEYMRDLEDRFHDAVGGGDFEGVERKSDRARVTLIRHLASDFSINSLRARRADLFMRTRAK